MVKGMAHGGPGSEHKRMIFGRENTNYEPPAAAAAGATSLAPSIGATLSAATTSEGRVSFAGLHGKDVTEAMLSELSDGMRNVMESQEGLDEYLDFLRSRYSYSFNNTILLMLQKPTGHTFRTYKQWAEDGYQVRKGAKAAKILRPILVKKKRKEDDDNGSENSSDDKQEDKDKKETHYTAFKEYSVFSNEDLDESVKEPPHSPLLNYFNRQQEIMAKTKSNDAMIQDLEAVSEKMDIEIKRVPQSELGENTRGRARLDVDGKHRILLSEELEGMQTARTLAHEIGHIACGHIEFEPERKLSRGQKEAEAETVAYGILRAYGEGNTSKSSQAYLAGWTGGDEQKIKDAMGGVQKGMQKYFSTLEDIVNGENQIDQAKAVSERSSKAYAEKKAAGKTTTKRKPRKRTVRKATKRTTRRKKAE